MQFRYGNSELPTMIMAALVNDANDAVIHIQQWPS